MRVVVMVVQVIVVVRGVLLLCNERETEPAYEEAAADGDGGLGYPLDDRTHQASTMTEPKKVSRRDKRKYSSAIDSS